jgi:ABC-2 type transport system ATP-binding protein
VTREELPAVERTLSVICTKLAAGRTIAHVYAESSPGPDFEPVEPDMKDVYFSVMAGHVRRGTMTPRPAATLQPEAVS